jgi:dihydrofolate reductase
MAQKVEIIQYNDVSLDGYIAGADDDTSWIPECGGQEFEEVVSNNEVILMGRRSYEFAVIEEMFPYDCSLNLIMTHDEEQLENDDNDGVIFTDKTPEEVVELIGELGFNSVFLMGGGQLNTSFLEANLIDEIILTVHPIVLGDGIKLYEGLESIVNFDLISQKDLVEGSRVLKFVAK